MQSFLLDETLCRDTMRFLLRRGYAKTPEEAEDAVQDAALSAWMFRGAFRGDSTMKTWFVRIAINHIKMRSRRAEAATTHSIDPEIFDRFKANAQEPPDYYLRTKILKALNRLTPIDRQVLIEVYLAERSLTEVARLLSLPRNRMKMRAFRARKKMRRILAA